MTIRMDRCDSPVKGVDDSKTREDPLRENSEPTTLAVATTSLFTTMDLCPFLRRWCNKRQVFAFAGTKVCPTGSNHDHTASGNYTLSFGVGLTPNGQDK
ncbi:hypothetical protein BC936DRAFT_145556 [Jimgerdemannia flammicorona]|uniref:Uncharacterized protein n=1 Tax=Jimgerdemannia flammicorona TaxID=994334 RepID=A0A433DAE7_9FUNG|nr:hypothetical protein BC936DRAFT_145556 [Jimgerdemannia flammicorona]